MHPFRSILTALMMSFAGSGLSAQEVPAGAKEAVETKEAEIKKWIDQLAFDHPRASATPLLSPGVRKEDDDAAYRKQQEKCQEAFRKLSEYKEAAFPLLLAHLNDQRPSIHFRNHYMNHSVGDACYWNLYFQLQDQPPDYSTYGLSRTGRDGQSHEKPYWTGTPFDEAGGVARWLELHKNLTYPEKQIECLTWLLTKERAIGAPDAESYFKNILPLEVRIAERKVEAGLDAKPELKRLRKVLKKKIASEIPAGTLPEAKPAPVKKKTK